MFGPKTANPKLVAGWTANFKEVKAQCVSVTDSDGILNIPWPNTLDDQPVDFDAILATATKPDAKQPTAHAVADAWITQREGKESYFFKNVQHRIRTPSDGEIWSRIGGCFKPAGPALGSLNPAKTQAVAILRAFLFLEKLL